MYRPGSTPQPCLLQTVGGAGKGCTAMQVQPARDTGDSAATPSNVATLKAKLQASFEKHGLLESVAIERAELLARISVHSKRKPPGDVLAVHTSVPAGQPVCMMVRFAKRPLRRNSTTAGEEAKTEDSGSKDLFLLQAFNLVTGDVEMAVFNTDLLAGVGESVARDVLKRLEKRRSRNLVVPAVPLPSSADPGYPLPPDFMPPSPFEVVSGRRPSTTKRPSISVHVVPTVPGIVGSPRRASRGMRLAKGMSTHSLLSDGLSPGSVRSGDSEFDDRMPARRSSEFRSARSGVLDGGLGAEAPPLSPGVVRPPAPSPRAAARPVPSSPLSPTAATPPRRVILGLPSPPAAGTATHTPPPSSVPSSTAVAAGTPATFQRAVNAFAGPKAQSKPTRKSFSGPSPADTTGGGGTWQPTDGRKVSMHWQQVMHRASELAAAQHTSHAAMQQLEVAAVGVTAGGVAVSGVPAATDMHGHGHGAGGMPPSGVGVGAAPGMVKQPSWVRSHGLAGLTSNTSFRGAAHFSSAAVADDATSGYQPSAAGAPVADATGIATPGAARLKARRSSLRGRGRGGRGGREGGSRRRGLGDTGPRRNVTPPRATSGSGRDVNESAAVMAALAASMTPPSAAPSATASADAPTAAGADVSTATGTVSTRRRRSSYGRRGRRGAGRGAGAGGRLADREAYRDKQSLRVKSVMLPVGRRSSELPRTKPEFLATAGRARPAGSDRALKETDNGSADNLFHNRVR